MAELTTAALLVPVLWLGFVLAISFLEAPLKFRAPRADYFAALSIGQLVFRALNRVELFLALVTIIGLRGAGWPVGPSLWFAAAAGILLLQTVKLLPPLDAAATRRLAGETAKSTSPHHLFYVIAEIAKVVALIGLIAALIGGILEVLP